MSKCNLHKEAYRYIQAILGKLSFGSSDEDRGLYVSLGEIRQLKEGVADSSVSLVASLKKC